MAECPTDTVILPIVTPERLLPCVLPVITPAFEIRSATIDDLTFIDSLQRKHTQQVGFLPTAWLQKILTKDFVDLAFENGQPAAYLLGKSHYQSRQHVGIIYQACVEYDAQRRAIGTALVTHYLARMPQTTKLIGLWCAQDLEANYFWEAVGFRPLAYRAGSRKKERVHIYWQRRVWADDQATHLWFPDRTWGGAMRENRTVIPIAGGDTWTSEKDLALSLPAEGLPPMIPGSRGSRKLTARERQDLERLRREFLGPPEGFIRVLGGKSFAKISDLLLYGRSIYNRSP